jgi:voltage-gated potassium channel Kch
MGCLCGGSTIDFVLCDQVLHKVGAERACAAAITLDTPGANYRTVWALSKYFPNVKTFVRAHDVDHGLNLEKAGATAVILKLLNLFLLVSFDL